MMKRVLNINDVPSGYHQRVGQPVDLSYLFDPKVVRAASRACTLAVKTVLETWRSINPHTGINYDAEPGTDERVGAVASFELADFSTYVPARVVLDAEKCCWHYAPLEEGDVYSVGFQSFYFLTPDEGWAMGRFVAYPNGTVEVYPEPTARMAPVAVRNLLQKYFTEGALEVVA